MKDAQNKKNMDKYKIIKNTEILQKKMHVLPTKIHVSILK